MENGEEQDRVEGERPTDRQRNSSRSRSSNSSGTRRSSRTRNSYNNKARNGNKKGSSLEVKESGGWTKAESNNVHKASRRENNELSCYVERKEADKGSGREGGRESKPLSLPFLRSLSPSVKVYLEEMGAV